VRGRQGRRGVHGIRGAHDDPEYREHGDRDEFCHQNGDAVRSRDKVFKLDCDTDPGALTGTDVQQGEYPDDCRLADVVAFDVTAEGDNVEDPSDPIVTDDTGSFAFVAETGSKVVITEDVATASEGYAPRANPLVIPEAGPNAESPVFINLPVDNPGRVVIVKHTCPSDNDRDPRIIVGAPGQASTIRTRPAPR
jgi:hypothetical protein